MITQLVLMIIKPVILIKKGVMIIGKWKTDINKTIISIDQFKGKIKVIVTISLTANELIKMFRVFTKTKEILELHHQEGIMGTFVTKSCYNSVMIIHRPFISKLMEQDGTVSSDD